jgi:SWI/SNF-related matrix-associated actin-dependent regulator 1 of chromatin subfamily A
VKPKVLKLRPHQREGIAFLHKNRLRALVADSQGTGKTAMSIRAVATYPDALPALVVCPASVLRNWAREIQSWSPTSKILLVDDVNTPLPLLRARDLFVVVSWSLLDTRCEEFLKVGFRTVIADEIHYAKSDDTLRSRALAELVPKVPHVILMSGTPLVNRREELEVIQAFLGEGEPAMIRRVLEDVAPDVPAKSRAYLPVRLSERWSKEYKAADEDFRRGLEIEKAKHIGAGMAEEEVDRLLANEALIKIGYLRRIAGEGKTDAAVDWIERAVRLGEPVVVFIEHQAVLARLVKALTKQRIRHVVIDGNVSPRDREIAVRAFQAHEVPVFIGTKAAKEGITLTAARHLLFLERYWTSADEEQAEDRIRRLGQTQPTTIWYMQAVDTVDERIEEIVQGKRVIVREVIGSPSIEETPSGNVENLLRVWGSMTSAEDKPAPLALGEGPPREPLPSPSTTHAVVFIGERWSHVAAVAWCKMHGYAPSKLKDMKRMDMEGRFKLVIHPSQVFQKGSFSLVKVCEDVRIIVGKKLGKAEGRRVRNHMHRLRIG